MRADRGRARPAWYRRRLRLAPPASGVPDPTVDRAEALAKLAALIAADAGIPEMTRTRLLEPDATASVTIVIWHGFTNAPSQFVAVGERLRDAGYRVLLPRMPRHGLPDLLTRELAGLTQAELVTQVDDCIDIAAGLGDEVWVAGLSAGGIMASWAAATRDEVSRAVLAAPLVAPKGFPMPAVRLCVKFPRIVPRSYLWWDPRKKDALDDNSPYAYPGFPIPGVMPFLYLSESLFDHTVTVGHRLSRVVLVTNANDLAVRQDAAMAFSAEVFGKASDYVGEARIDPALQWAHDFVDPWSPAAGATEQVSALLESSFGVREPTAGGVLVPPLVTLG
ncbi:MAG: alpha/beta fold hydrolase [Micropruina sp.]|uniref:alpha/beta hydrolase n=1 Tax=Micropruina sp. TaxID=2737536 RepID=UPI0039E6A422